MPTWERKFRVIGDWIQNFFHGREVVNLEAVQKPRAAFEEFAARPRRPLPPPTLRAARQPRPTRKAEPVAAK